MPSVGQGMHRRALLFVLGLTFTLNLASSQAPPSLPEPCRGAASLDMKALQERKEGLGRDIAGKRTALGLAADQRPPASDPRSKALIESQESLLTLLFQIECANALPPPPSERNSTR